MTNYLALWVGTAKDMKNNKMWLFQAQINALQANSKRNYAVQPQTNHEKR